MSLLDHADHRRPAVVSPSPRRSGNLFSISSTSVFPTASILTAAKTRRERGVSQSQLGVDSKQHALHCRRSIYDDKATITELQKLTSPGK